MTFQTLGRGCSGPASSSAYGGLNCGAFRGIVAECTSNNDGINANMIAWLNAYDLTTIPWGILIGVTFSDPSKTVPDNLSSGGNPVLQDNGGYAGVSATFLIDNNGDPFVNASAQRSQVWWPGASPFGVVAVDCWNDYQTGYLCCTGTTTACGNIYELPLPNPALPSGVPWNRLRYTGVLGLTPSTIQAWYLSQLAFGVAASYGSGRTPTPSSPWDVNQVCQPAGDDPFTGDPDP